MAFDKETKLKPGYNDIVVEPFYTRRYVCNAVVDITSKCKDKLVQIVEEVDKMVRSKNQIWNKDSKDYEVVDLSPELIDAIKYASELRD